MRVFSAEGTDRLPVRPSPQPLVRKIIGISLGGKQLGRQANHLSLPDAKVKLL